MCAAHHQADLVYRQSFDRARLGYVIDFMDLHFGDFRPFLIFNVADTMITLGVLVLLARALFVREPKAELES